MSNCEEDIVACLNLHIVSQLSIEKTMNTKNIPGHILRTELYNEYWPRN